MSPNFFISSSGDSVGELGNGGLKGGVKTSMRLATLATRGLHGLISLRECSNPSLTSLYISCVDSCDWRLLKMVCREIQPNIFV